MNGNVEIPADVITMIENGKILGAIKVLRDSQGLGLKDARCAIDLYLQEKYLSKKKSYQGVLLDIKVVKIISTEQDGEHAAFYKFFSIPFAPVPGIYLGDAGLLNKVVWNDKTFSFTCWVHEEYVPPGISISDFLTDTIEEGWLPSGGPLLKGIKDEDIHEEED
ncbi:MAG: hypothetical protein ACOY32_05655 [Thermodesulfobacteriota bacterium]